MNDIDTEAGCTFQGISRAAFLQLLEHRRSKLLRVALRITRNWEESEDIVQESALKALLHLDRFRGESQIDTWLCSIVVNSAISRLRARRWRYSVSLDSGLEDDGVSLLDTLANSERDPEQRFAQQELLAILFSEIRQLKPMYRSVIELCDIEECSGSEAAKALNLNAATMKARLFRGRKILRQRMHHRIWQGSAHGVVCSAPEANQSGG